MPFVATSPEQIRVGDEVEANDEDGEIVRGTVLKIEMRSGSERAVIHFGEECRMWHFDPYALGFERTWTVLNRNLEPDVPEIRVGDRVVIVDRFEGVVTKVRHEGVRLGSGIWRDFNPSKRPLGVEHARTFEVLERAPEPLTPEQKLEKIKALAVNLRTDRPDYVTREIASQIESILEES